MPDLDSLSGSALTSGSGGSAGSASDAAGSAGDTGATGGTQGSSGGAGGTDAGSAGTAGTAAQPAPQVRYDFEANIQGWLPVGDQRPVGVQDSIDQSTEQAHSGTGSLRIVFDGLASIPDAGEPNPWYGVYKPGVVPAYETSFWIMPTMQGISVDVYCQTGPTYAWNVLTNAALTENEWQEITVTMLPEVQQWGIKVTSPFDIQGSIYIDEVSW